MEANNPEESDVGSENMPQLEASVDPEILLGQVDEDDEEGGDDEEEVSNESHTPILEQQQTSEDTDVEEPNDVEMVEGEMVEDEGEEIQNEMDHPVDEEEDEGILPSDENIQDNDIEHENEEEEEGIIQSDENLHVSLENDLENENEEEEEEYENEGNPSAQNNNDSSSNDGQIDDGREESEDKKDEDSLQVKMEDAEKSASESEKVDTIMTRKRSASISSGDDGPKRKSSRSASSEQERTHDNFCWVCHKDGVYFKCKICPRSYHMRCICLPDYPEPTLPEGDGSSKNCICPECVVVMNAENVDKRSAAMKQLNMSQLVNMLSYICGRMKQTPGVEPFVKPVQPSDACDYYEYIIYPMDIQTLEKNIKQRQYGSTEAFLADAQWLVHNSIIFNSSSSPYTASAKRILKVCKQELSEIETCPECYTNAHTKSETWFVEACKRPHILVWAKLKGFPYWPAKAMKIKDDQVDVRFFGQHDRAWVNLKDCYLYSEEMPASPPKKNAALLAAIDELNTHVLKLNEAYGAVVLAPAKTPLGRELSIVEIQRLLPEFKPAEPSQPRTSSQVAGKGGIKGQLPKSPMTITISSLKTNPTIVNNTVTESSATTSPASKPSIKSKRLSNVNTSDSSLTSSSVVLATTKGNTKGTTISVASNVEPSPIIAEAPIAIKVPSPEPILPTLKQDEQQPTEEKSKKELDDDFESRVPSGEILASALGLKRITRRLSQNEASVALKSEDEKLVSTPGLASTISLVEKRLVRGSKPDDDSESQLQAQLKKSPRISVTPVESTPTVTIQPPPITVNIKTEPIDPEQDDEDDEQDEKMMDIVGGTTTTQLRNKAQDFMEHISTQAQTKPGYRFNISKDISISAIGQDSQDVLQDEAKNSLNALHDSRLRKSYGLGPSVTVNTTGGGVPSIQRPSLMLNPNKQQQQILQANSPGNIGAQRPRFNPAQAMQPQGARFMNVNKDLRALTRLLRPARAKTPPSNATTGGGGGNVRPNRAVPGAIQMSSLRGNSLLHKFGKDGAFKQQPIIVDSTMLRVDNSNHYGGSGHPLQKVGPAIQVNQVQSQSITLPGGTITVTPLSGGNPNTNNYGSSSNSLNMNGGDRSAVNISLSKTSGGNTTTTPNGLPNLDNSSGSNSNSPACLTAPMTTIKAGGKLSSNPHGGGGGQNSNSRLSASKGLVNMVPSSVVQTVQMIQKSVSEIIRQGTEQIVVDMVEHEAAKIESDKNYNIEHDKLKHIKEITDMRHNHEILMRELRSNMENEKKRAIADIRRQCEQDKQKAIEEAKRKQWCAHCLREALFYCCWNTSYCGYPCQENHWPLHLNHCSNTVEKKMKMASSTQNPGK